MSFYDHNKLSARTQDPASLGSYLISRSINTNYVPLQASFSGVIKNKITSSIVPLFVQQKISGSGVGGPKDFTILSSKFNFYLQASLLPTQSLEAQLNPPPFFISYPNELDNLTIDYSRIKVDTSTITMDNT